jgi:hypothetical protein
MHYQVIATLAGGRRKSIVNKSEEQVLTEYVIPYIRNGVIKARWGAKLQSYQVLELRVHGTKDAWHKGSGTPLDRFIAGTQNRYFAFEKRARRALSSSAHRVFVVMPIQGEQFGSQDEQRIWREYDGRFEAIEALLGKYDAVAIRIDKEHTLDELVKRIKEEITKCRFVIADMTDERPSCYYEAGFAEALQKPVIFVASKESVVNPRTPTRIHFDIHRNVNFFVNLADLRSKLKAALDKNRVLLFGESKELDRASPHPKRAAPRKAAVKRSAHASAGRQKATGAARGLKPRRSTRPGTEIVFNDNEKSILRVLGSATGSLSLAELAAAAFPALDATKAHSWTRNSVRKPLKHGVLERAGKGAYKLRVGQKEIGAAE